MSVATPIKRPLVVGSMLSPLILTGCVVWKSDYDALKAQNQQLQQQVAAYQGYRGKKPGRFGA